MQESIFEPTIDELGLLNPDEAVQVIRDLLYSEAARIGVNLVDISVPSVITASDGGVDAEISTENFSDLNTNGLIPDKLTRYQIKTGKFPISKTNKRKIRELILKPSSLNKKKLTSDDINPRIRTCLEKEGTFVTVLFGSDNPDHIDNETVDSIRDELVKINASYKNAKVRVWRPNQLTKIISRFPSLALSIKKIKSKSLHEFSYMRNNCHLEGEQYLKTEKHNEIIAQIQSSFLNKEGLTHIRIVGEPGIGKTRLIYESIYSSALSAFTIYIENWEQFLQDGTLRDISILVNDSPLILIVDECNPSNRSEIHRKLNSAKHPLTLITIYNELDEQDRDNQYYNFIDPPKLPDEKVSEILQSYGVPKDEADRIVSYCSGSPRVAHIVGQNLRTNPALTSLTQLKGLESIWDIYIVGRGDHSPEEERNRKLILSFLGLFKQFGWEGQFKNEAKIIFGLIQEADNSITWDKFDNVIEQLRKRRILQGYSTLYITPKLLHIKLWCDWWKKYSHLFNIEKLLTDLPESLRHWFNEMFLYAKESNQAEEIITELLKSSSLFGDLSTYGKNGDLFIMLAQNNPGAAVRAAHTALESKTHDELTKFTSGRRQLIHALEKIALHSNFFEDAANCLRKLAEAENERWSNNATGVFVDLFNLGYGKIASTDLSPIERLPILKKMVVSSSEKTRLLALDAFDKALTMRFSRIDIRNSIGLYPIPQGWMPKTYGELWEIYRIYLESLWEIRDQLSNSLEKRKIAKIIFSHTRSLISIPGLNVILLNVLESLSKEGEEEKLAVISTLVEIIHYDSKGMDKEVLEKIQVLNSQLSEDSFSAKLKRFVGLNLLEDRYNKNGEQDNYISIQHEKLAQEIHKNSKLLENEIDWLVTKLAANGYEFGKTLASFDESVSLWPLIYNSWLSDKDSTDYFIGGYLSGVYQNDVNKWESLINQIANGSGVSKLHFLIWRSGMTRKSAEILLDNAKKGLFPLNDFKIFIYGAISNQIPQDILIQVLELLIDTNDKINVYSALELSYSLVHNKQKLGDDFVDMFERVLSHPIFFASSNQKITESMIEYDWNQLALYVEKIKPERAIVLLENCIKHIGEPGTIFDSFHPDGFPFIDQISQKNPTIAWKLISKLIEPPFGGNAMSIMQWLRGGFDLGRNKNNDIMFNVIPVQDITSWIDQDVDKRAPAIARFVPIFLDNFKDSLAYVILKEYGNKKNVRNSIRASFHTESWFGLRSLHFKNKLERIHDIKKKEQNKNILLWLNEEIDVLKNILQKAEDEEERGDL